MSEAAKERVSNLSLQRQIAEFSAHLDQIAVGITEIKQMLNGIEERVRALENREAGSHPLMESRIDAAWRKLDEHDQRIKALEEMIVSLHNSNRLMAWLGGILGSTVLIWLITQLLEVIK
jgi:predicted RNase H-like nuclease (RuvC/YqgF family)